MTRSPLQGATLFCPPEGAPLRSTFGRWTVLEYQVVTSTNLVASAFGAWHALRAARQTGGRGRFERHWISDVGGLWMSAVLPIDRAAPLGLLPLRVGLAVCETLQELGLGSALRMRWPNDVLVGNRKLAGLLIDQFVAELAVCGVGVNVTNRPERSDPALCGQVTHLAELIASVPTVNELLLRLLDRLERIAGESTDAVLPRLNALWRPRQQVQIELEQETVIGEFDGVDAVGRLILRPADQERKFYEPHEVRLLREIIRDP